MIKGKKVIKISTFMAILIITIIGACYGISYASENKSQITITTDIYTGATETVDAVTVTTTGGKYRYDIVNEIFTLVNEEREKEGKAALKYSADLTEVAMERAVECSVYYSHTRPTSETCFTLSSLMYGENIAWTSQGYSGTASDLAEVVMKTWMNSQGHKDNILGTYYDYTSIGIGVYYINGNTYYVQNFGYETSPNETQSTSTMVSNTSDSTTIRVNNGYIDLNVSVPSTTLNAGETETAYASLSNVGIYESTGSKVYSFINNSDVTWTSSDENVFTVSDGEITAISAGTATLTVSLGEDSETFTIVVEGTAAADTKELTIDNSEINLEISSTGTKTQNIGAKYLVNNIEDTTTTITYTSSDTSVATVDSTGLVTAVGKGSTTISVSAGYISKDVTVNVTVPLESISLDTTNTTLEVGNTLQLNVTYSPSKDETSDDTTISWITSDDSVATISSNGTITAVAAGTATITAKTSGGLTSTCTVTVTNPALESISVTAGSTTLVTGDSTALTVAITPTNATYTGNVTYESSDSSILTVNESGTVTAVAAGTATITASLDGKTSQVSITVEEKTVDLTSIEVTAGSTTLEIDGTTTLTVTKDPANATTTGSVTYASSDTSILTVDENGTVTAIAAGTATITASLDGKTSQVSITVEEKTVDLTSIEVTAGSTTLEIDGTTTLTVTKDPTNATTTGSVTYASSDTSILTVDENGTVTAIAAGTATITASLDGKTSQVSITVEEKTVDLQSIEVAAESTTLEIDGTTTLTVTKNPTNATTTGNVTYTSSDTGILTVDSSGKVTAVSAGTATITASLDGKTSQVSITVNSASQSGGEEKKDETIDLQSIEVTAENTTLEINDSTALTVAINPTNATVTGSVTYTSSDTSILTVDASGKVIAVSVGTATITASLDGKTSQVLITVNSAKQSSGEEEKKEEEEKDTTTLQSITVSAGVKTLEIDGTTTLTVAVSPTNATYTGSVKYTSSDTSILTVDSSGKVTAVSAGTATITVSLDGVTSEVTLTVNNTQSSNEEETNNEDVESEETDIENEEEEEDAEEDTEGEIESESDDTVYTGDIAIEKWVCLMIASGIGIIITIRKRINLK